MVKQKVISSVLHVRFLAKVQLPAVHLGRVKLETRAFLISQPTASQGVKSILYSEAT